MGTTDGPRRLRLASATPQLAQPLASRAEVAGCAIGIADVVPEAGALLWATWLVEALAEQRAQPHVFVLAFDAPPDPPRELCARLERAAASVAIRALSPTEQAATDFADELAGRAFRAPLVLLGEPAVAALEASLGVLVGVDALATRQLPSLRPWRDSTPLCLADPRKGVAEQVARALARTLSA